jgi:GntR family transcriptional regulator
MENELAIPYYLQVAETIRKRIVAGAYIKGGTIPSYQELEKEFDVSNITVRKAIETLVRDGIVERRRGVGMFVSQHDQKMITFELDGNFQRLRQSYDVIPWVVEVLEIGITSPPIRIQQIFSMEPEKKVWRMTKVRKYKDTIMSYYINYSDPRWCGKITREGGEKKRFTDLFSQKSGIRLVRLEQRVEAAVADLDLSSILKVSFGFPLLFVENIYYSDQNKPVALTQMYNRGDRHCYKTTAPL